MARNGSGTYSLLAVTAPANTVSSSTTVNNNMNDIATALTESINKDGTKAWAANQTVGGFKFTSLGDGSARNDSIALGQVQDGKANWVAAGGTADAITATYSPAITALVDGQICFFRASGANTTTTPTFAPNGLTARTIVKLGGSALAVGDIPAANYEVAVRYLLASTRWEMLNPATSSVNGASVSATSLAASGAFTLSGDISPAQITANQDDYAPTGYLTCTRMRLDTDASRNITGIQGGADGRVLIINNIGSNPIILTHDATSTAANRILCPNSVSLTLSTGTSCTLVYDATDSRWRVVAIAWARASQADMEAATSGSVICTPFNLHNHPAVPKVWVQGTPNSTTILSSYNVTSLGDTNTGQQTVTIATDFSAATYCVQVTIGDTSTVAAQSATVMTKAAGSYIMNSAIEGGSGDDPAEDWNSVAFGDQ